MTKAEPVLRPARIEDFVALYGEAPARTCFAYAADLDGKVVGVGGVSYHSEGHVFFSKILDELRPHRRFIVKAARIVADVARKAGAKAIADPREARSSKLLTHLGFTKIDDSAQGEVFAWKR